ASALRGGQMWSIWAVILICVLLPFALRFSISLADIKVAGLTVGGFGENGVFYLLALIPGAAAIIHHVVSRSFGQATNLLASWRYGDIRRKINHEGLPTGGTGAGGAPGKRLKRATLSAVASALLLSSLFLLIAAAFDRWGFGKAPATIKGLIAAGLGSYVSVVYYMTARMYANALSSRFVSASALRVAFSAGFGVAADAVGLTAILPQGQTPWVALFLLGLFQNAAYSAIRTRANTWFGAAKAENEELPLDTIQGIDDTTIDLL